MVFAGVADRLYTWSTIGFFEGEPQPNTLTTFGRYQTLDSVDLANDDIFAPKLDHISLMLPTLMLILEECGRPLDTFTSHDRSKLLWWILRFAQEAQGDPDLAEVHILRAVMRVYWNEQWTPESARKLALNYGVIHSVARLFEKVSTASLNRTVLETEPWHGYIDCIPGLRYLCTELNLNSSEQHNGISSKGRALACFEFIVSRASSGGDKVRAVQLMTADGQLEKCLTPVIYVLMNGVIPVRPVMVELARADSETHETSLLKSPGESTQAWLLSKRAEDSRFIQQQSCLFEEAPWRTVLSDVFFPSFHVPSNPSDIVLKFADETTEEGRLMMIVLEPSACAFQGSRGVVGPRGVGKSCMLRGLGQESMIKKRYPGGVYWVSFGEHLDEKYVIDQFAEIVKNTNGYRSYELIRKSRSVEEAFWHTTQWFRGHCSLFLFDDFWSTEGRRIFLGHMARYIADFALGSCVVYSGDD